MFDEERNNNSNDNSRYTSDSYGGMQNNNSMQNNSSMNAGSSGNNNANHYDEYRYAGVHIPPENNKNNKPKKKGGFGRKVLATVALGLIFGAVAGGALYATSLITGQNRQAAFENSASSAVESGSDKSASIATVSGDSQKSVATTNQVSSTAPMTGDASAVAEAVMPSIVAITNNYTSTTQDFFGQQYQTENESAGSGFIISQNDDELLIATNEHVVSSADKLQVQFVDGTTAEASLKGEDEGADLAVISVKLSDVSSNTISQIKVATLGDSDTLKVGQQVVAIGNALGYGQSVTQGVVSAIDRELQLDNGTHKLIQTDAAINPGNSGGALLDMNGNVIGINEAKLAETGVEGMGYSIPISTAKPIIESLMSQETKTKADESERGYLGISGADVTSDVASQYNMPQGIYIARVGKGLAAEAAGLEKGDIITSFDGQGVQTMTQLQSLIQYYKAGQTVEIVAMVPKENEYGYEEKKFSVTLGSSMDSSSSSSGSSSGSSGQNDQQMPGNGNGGNGNNGNNGSSIFGDFFGGY
ncbi:MAG: trypsin-like peptidase domain-containing protein [Lachnospiraceae bacterium]|nr:trypsin-like peptidase domain-containing protein [Lachnospiraceae bacterium]